MSETKELLDELDALRAKATPGRWMFDSHEIYQEWPGIAGMSGEWIGETCRVEGDPLHSTSDADAALIVAAVNAVPQLTAALRAVLAVLDDAEARNERNSFRFHDGSKPRPDIQVDAVRTAITTALEAS